MTLQIHNLFDAFWKSTTDEICPNLTFILRTQKHVHFDNFQFSRVNIATMPHYPCRETRYLKVTKFHRDWCDHLGPTFLLIDPLSLCFTTHEFARLHIQTYPMEDIPFRARQLSRTQGTYFARFAPSPRVT